MDKVTAPELATLARRAHVLLAPYVRKTPLVFSPFYSALHGHRVYLKLENRQCTGSFKLRGATHRLLKLTPAEREAGCVTASSGNHGAATAAAMSALGVHGTVYVPETVSPTKLDAIRRFGGTVIKFGTDGLDTELEARRVASVAGMVYISPYNDQDVMAGQGTIGVELLEQLPDFNRVLIAVGGGGLISGVASVLKDALPGIRVVGCQPRASAIMAASCRAGRIVEEASSPTLSDGTAGGVEVDAITFPLCQALIDRFSLIREAAIAREMQRYKREHGSKIEGAAALALAALSGDESRQDDKTVVVICGRNVSDSVFATTGDLARRTESLQAL